MAVNKQTNKQTGDLISVIIPVYNAEPYIENLLESLFRQTYPNFEIILAYDEKSTDGTLSLIQRMAETHTMIIDIANDSSVGSARNRGFALASGEFVVFVDADDEVMPEYLESLHHIFELYPELDVACCNALDVLYSDDINLCRKKARESENTITTFKRDEILLKWIYTKIRMAWIYMVRVQYLIEIKNHFPESSMGEDQIWVSHTIGNTQFVGCTTKILYLYIQRPTSLCNEIGNDIKQQKKREEGLKAREHIVSYFSSISDCVVAEYVMREMAMVYPYTDWIEFLKKQDCQEYITSIKLQIPHTIRDVELRLFKINKKLYHIYIQSIHGHQFDKISEKVISFCFRRLQALYHTITH